MKIIIINYRYFISGGPERYLFNVKTLLEKNGHTVIPFSIKNKQNQHTEYERYFLNSIGDDKVYFKEYEKTNLKTLARIFSRMFYSYEAKKKLSNLIKDTRPDLIYVLHYQNKISSSIFDAARKNKIPVVQRISDFGHICANALFFRPVQKDICERCLHGSKLNAIKNKCVHSSYLYSSIKAASLKFQEINKTTKKVKAFVVPSKFTIEKLKSSGFTEKNLNHIPSFFNFQSVSKELKISYEPFALYIGRIEPEKGLFTLIKSFENSGFNLKIIGFSNSNFDQELKNYLKDKKHHIEFLGRKDFDEIQIYLSKCSFTIVPSEWYDNFPNTILESFAFKKCIIATNIGSLREAVIDNETGMLFKIKDRNDLKNKVEYLFNDLDKCKTLGENGYHMLMNKYSANNHYTALINLFENAIQN